jgi:hypothetical protein
VRLSWVRRMGRARVTGQDINAIRDHLQHVTAILILELYSFGYDVAVL